MTLHLVKLCVGADTVDDLRAWVRKRSAQNKAAGMGRVHDHVTRMFPKRREELLDGGSIYWVIKGVVLARQRLLGFDKRIGADGIERCAIIIDPKLVDTAPQPRRAFQGWRYLRAEDAPEDSDGTAVGALAPELGQALAELGLL